MKGNDSTSKNHAANEFEASVYCFSAEVIGRGQTDTDIL